VRTAVQLGRSGPGGADFRTVRAEYGLVFALTVEQKFSQAKELLEEANSALAHVRNVDLLTASRRDVINGTTTSRCRTTALLRIISNERSAKRYSAIPATSARSPSAAPLSPGVTRRWDGSTRRRSCLPPPWPK